MAIQKQTLIGLVLGYTAVAGGAAAFGYYAYGQYTEAREQEAAIQKQIDLAKIKVARIEGLEVDVICLRENLSEAAKILPDDAEVNEFVNKLNDFADEAGTFVQALDDQKDRSRTKDSFDKVIYKISMLANVEQFLSFLALAEGWERFVKVTSIDVKAGAFDEGMARDEVRHEITVSLQTYAYRGPDESSAVQIINYDSRREALREEILARRAEIQVERYNFLPNPMRRDMFIDPRHRASEEGEGGLPIAEQRALVDAMVGEAEDLLAMNELVEQDGTPFLRRLELQMDIDKRVDLLESALIKVNDERQVTDRTQYKRLDFVRASVRDLRDLSEVPSAVTTEELRAAHAEMALNLEDGEFEAVIRRHEAITARVVPDALDHAGVALLNDINKAAIQAETAKDFAGIDIEIRGAIVADNGSVAVINGRVLQEGDALGDDLVLHRVLPDRIEFRYRGVILARNR